MESNNHILPISAVKLIGKLQDGTVFVKKGHGDNESDLFEFKTDEGTFFFSFWLFPSDYVICSCVYLNLCLFKQSKLLMDWTRL